MKLFAFFSIAAAASYSTLCADWQQQSLARCTLNTGCCVSTTSGSSPFPQCSSNPPQEITTLSIVSQESYKLAGDGSYSVQLLVATGQSCPLLPTDGTVLFNHIVEGTYSAVDSNASNVTDGWIQVQYTPMRFITTVVKSNQIAPFTAGVYVGSINKTLSPCMLLRDYLNNPTGGCPCNGTWVNTVTRDINASTCPAMDNSTNSTMGNSTMGNSTSCPEHYFFNTAPRYGNVRVSNFTKTIQISNNPNTNMTGNNTNMTASNITFVNVTYRLLEVTQPLFNSTDGFNNTIVYATFTANDTCPATLNSTTLAPTSSPTAHPTAVGSAGRATLHALAYLAVLWLLA